MAISDYANELISAATSTDLLSLFIPNLESPSVAAAAIQVFGNLTCLLYQ